MTVIRCVRVCVSVCGMKLQQRCAPLGFVVDRIDSF